MARSSFIVFFFWISPPNSRYIREDFVTYGRGLIVVRLLGIECYAQRSEYSNIGFVASLGVNYHNCPPLGFGCRHNSLMLPAWPCEYSILNPSCNLLKSLFPCLQGLDQVHTERSRATIHDGTWPLPEHHVFPSFYRLPLSPTVCFLSALLSSYFQYRYSTTICVSTFNDAYLKVIDHLALKSH